MNTQELLEQIHSVLEVLTAEHAKPAKAAKGRARKAAGEIKKLIFFLDEKDRRRNTNWENLFPWLIKYRELCGITK